MLCVLSLRGLKSWITMSAMSTASRSEKIFSDLLNERPSETAAASDVRQPHHRIYSEPTSPTTTGSNCGNSTHKFPFPSPQQVPTPTAAAASQVETLYAAYLNYFQHLFEKLVMLSTSSSASASSVSPPAPESPAASASSTSPTAPPDRPSQSAEKQSAKRAKFSIASLLESDRRAPEDERTEQHHRKCGRSFNGVLCIEKYRLYELIYLLVHTVL